MFRKIKKEVEKELQKFAKGIDKLYALDKISPLLSRSINNFILRKGKRIRPVLFVIGYLGFAKHIAPNLYTSALSLELLHDFMLVHDDIIDKSDTRRGKPSMHQMFNAYLKRCKNIKFSGQDLSIVGGDVMYAMATDAFLSIKEKAKRKEKALKKLIQTAMYTASGEFLELLIGMEDLKAISEQDIYKIYDFKTAYYTFASPLSIGATLGSANRQESDKLFQYGLYVGRAFQIKDDISGMFSSEIATGKSSFTDLQEAKRTILIWYAYNRCGRKEKSAIEKVLSKKRIAKSDLLKMRRIVTKSGALDYARKEISRLIKESGPILASSNIRTKYKNSLKGYCHKLLFGRGGS